MKGFDLNIFSRNSLAVVGLRKPHQEAFAAVAVEWIGGSLDSTGSSGGACNTSLNE